MNNFSANDTFDNFSFTTSGQLVYKSSNAFKEVQMIAIKKKWNDSKNDEDKENDFKISFDDSEFMNDSFFAEGIKDSTEILPKGKSIDTAQRLVKNVGNSKNSCNSPHSNMQKYKTLDITITPTKSKPLLTNNLRKSTACITNTEIISKENNNRCESRNMPVTRRVSKCQWAMLDNTPKKCAITTDKFKSQIRKERKLSCNVINANEETPNLNISSFNNHSHYASTSNNTSCKQKISQVNISSNSERLSLSILGLPQQILQKYRCRNVTAMFPWQLECLSCDNVLENGKNLIYSAPTSAGKTLVSEILAIKTVLERNKKVLFILPFVSVVREKMFYFQDIFGTSGIRVEGFMGSYNPPGGFKNVNLAICTIEKANALVNRLLEEGKLGDIGTVIVDELHLLGDSSRGYLLELLLTKLQYVSLQNAELNIQIIGMSATLPNLDLLGKWLNAALYITDFRPVPLNEQYLVDRDIFNSQMSLIRRLEPIPDLDTDTDNVLQLCLETILISCSVLIFCPTKQWCESLAVQIATAFYKLGTSQSTLGSKLRSQILAEPIRECLEQLKRSPSGLDEVLHKTVSFGVAFHHAGLTMDERDIIEGGFRSNALRVLVATSTLSSGVNLPARRVIIRTPCFYGKPIDILSYKQMVGRAGRMGKDTAGESILICKKTDLTNAHSLISGKLEAITSCLESSGRLKRAILEIIASGVATTPDEIESFGNCTLLSHEGTTVSNPLSDALDFLLKYQFIRLQLVDDVNHYVATPLAKACLNSSLPPEEGLTLFAELEKARQCFVLESELHIVYLVTPYSAQISTIDWMQFLDMWEKLPASMKRVGELVGIKVSFIINCSRGKVSNSSGKLAIHRRFYTALALQDLVNEVPLNEVARKFGCNRGALQGLQQSAATFAGMVTAFSKQLGWSSVELLVGQFQDRLQFGVSRDLLDLMRLPILNGLRARVLFNAGVKNLIELAACDSINLENILHKAKPFESKEREGESKQEAEKRQQLRTIFITGKRGLTELEAAKLMISDARQYLQYEIGLSDAKWSQRSNKDNDDMNITKNFKSILKSNISSNSQSELQCINEVHVEKKINQDESLHNGNSFSSINKSVNIKTTVDSVGNISLNSFEISTSPTSIRFSINDNTSYTKDIDCNLTSLKLSSPFHSLSENLSNASCLRARSPKEKNSSCESLFNDSFNKDMINIPFKSESILEKQLNLDSNEHFLTKDFLDSFNENLSLNITDNFAKSSNIIEKLPKGNIINAKKRNSDEIYSSLSDDSVNILQENDDTFGPSSTKILKKNSIKINLQEILEIINICHNRLLYNEFLFELKTQATISIALSCETHEQEKQVIGIRKAASKDKEKFTYKTIKLLGISFYWPNETNTTYYIELEKLIQISDNYKEDLKNIEDNLMKKQLKIFNAKETLKVLHWCLGWKIDGVKVEDSRIADWLLNPESNEKNLRSMVKVYSSDLQTLLELGDDIHNKKSANLNKNIHNSKIKACLESLINWQLTQDVTQRLIAEDPSFINYYQNEMEIITILAKMELSGVPVNLKILQSFADSLKLYIRSIETEAYNIAGRRFSFTSSASVSKVLNMRAASSKHNKPATNKAALIQYDNPLAELIIQWRKLNSTLTRMVYPLLRNIENNRVYGNCITHNSTGRVSMHEPNLQNVPRDFEFINPCTKKTHDICIRNAFSVAESDCVSLGKYVIVSADYCQLELRLLAHMSQDSTLCKIMRSDGDIFKSIAAKWMKIKECEVDLTLRQQTKQICYGIIYGIGNKALSDQMNITEDEALTFTESFHRKFPGIRNFIRETISKCEEHCYVETFLGRRRYLPMIKSSNTAEKSKAERQAVNSTVQGSAADIAKQAMILVDKKLQAKFRNSRNLPKLILQLHDELLYEVPLKYEDAFARILRKCMQESVKLSVPLPVKVQSGKSWGSLLPK